MPDDEFKKKVKRFLNELPKVQADATLKAGQQILRDMNIRIFGKGRNAEDGKIGNYSTRPILIGKKSFTSKTRANSAVFGSKKKRASFEWRTLGTGATRKRLVLLEGGYKKLRALNGLQNARVDLSFKGDLQRSLKLVRRKNAVEIRINGKEQIIKANANEKRFNAPIFEATETEIKIAERIIQDELGDLIKEIFK